jgi:hypothetical protein
MSRSRKRLVVCLLVGFAGACAESSQDDLEALGVSDAALVGVPARVEAEAYERFNETTPASNTGARCDRADGVDKQLTSDPNGGICNIGWTAAGEWLEYDVHVASEGLFAIQLRLASDVVGRTLHAELDGVHLGSLAAPGAGWQAWSDRGYSNVCLLPGKHVLRIVFDTGSVNFNYFELIRNAAPNPGCPATCAEQALKRTAAEASSLENASFPASHAIDLDGSLATRWSSAFSDPQWIYVDLGAPRHVSRVRLSWEAAASADYDVQISNSTSGPWNNLFTTAAGNGGVDDIGGLNGTGRYVRMYSRARAVLHGTRYGNSLFDFAVLGDINPNCSASQATDSDADRLPDSVETNTGVFVSPSDTGTRADDSDTDDDGIADGDEVLGTTAGLDLPGLGLDPLRKNVLLEYDWFDDALDCSQHSHRPNQALLDRVSTAFADAPVPNPNGTTGITLVHDYGQGGAFSGGNFIADADGIVDGFGSEYGAYKSAHFARNRLGYFHYVIMPHQYSSRSEFSSGLAFMIGSDMIVSLYCSNSNDNVGNTLMHELGHNLGLQHGGFEFVNFKPNYNSVMNYNYQFPGVDDDCTPPGDGVLDYSRNQRIVLDERALNETEGICNGVDWDWNRDSSIQTDVSFDLNGDSLLGTLRDHDDWGHLVYDFAPGPGAGAMPPSVSSRIVKCDNPAPTP